jgi:predicted metal-dependent enzyme (double-stranded beta helix superfamily)
MNLSEIVREILSERSIAPERPTPASLARYLLPEADRYLDRVRFDTAHYVRHPVLLWDDWEVMVIGWEAGQITPIHDHRGVLGGMAILSGTVVEERFTVPKDLPELVDSRVRPEGDLSDTGPTILHRLIPRSRSVSLHVYRPPLRTMGIWDARGGFQELRPSEFDVGDEVIARAVAAERSSPAPVA